MFMPFGTPWITQTDGAVPGRGASPRRRLYIYLGPLVLFALALAGVLGFRSAGRWLVREDPVAHATAIVVLSGSLPFRAEAAASLYREGYAPEVWLTRPETPAEELSRLNIPFQGEEQYDREVLMHLGVPANAIRILPREIVDTEQEIEEVSAALRGRLDGQPGSRESRVIIVTSPQHTRRVRALWRRLALANEGAVVRAAWQDPFDCDHWWRNTRDAYAVVREFLGLANTWTGLSVRPHSP